MTSAAVNIKNTSSRALGKKFKFSLVMIICQENGVRRMKKILFIWIFIFEDKKVAELKKIHLTKSARVNVKIKAKKRFFKVSLSHNTNEIFLFLLIIIFIPFRKLADVDR